MSLINREVLYEKACDLEAQALAYVGKIANDETKIEEWRIWSAILAERTAFKHDIFDAHEVKPEPHWIPVSERLPEESEDVLLQFADCMGVGFFENGGWAVNTGDGIFSEVGKDEEKPIAWMPTPEPYREEGD